MKKFCHTAGWTAKNLVAIMMFTIVTISIANSCKYNGGGNPPEPPIDTTLYPTTIEPLELEAIQSKYLDTIFSWKNLLIKLADKSSKIYTIKSKKELDEINSFGFDVNIDFSKYTLIGGIFESGNNVIKARILLEEMENNYLFDILYCRGNNEMIECFYFWRLYPKLKIDKEIIVEIESKFVSVDGGCDGFKKVYNANNNVAFI